MCQARLVSLFLVGLLIAAGAAAIEPQPGFVFAYGFELTAGLVTRDDSGHGNDGVLENGAARNPNGYFGQGVEFNGFAGDVDLDTLDFGGGNELSISMWIKPDDFGEPDARLLSKATGTTDAEHWVMLGTAAEPPGSQNIRLVALLKTDPTGVTTELIGDSNLSAGSWVYVTFVYDGATMELFQDCVSDGFVAKTGTVASDPTVVTRIGNQPLGGKTFDGLIDEVRAETRALSVADCDQRKITPVVCGNGTVEPFEECDDGNNDNGDGCDATCALEPQAVPSGSHVTIGALLLVFGILLSAMFHRRRTKTA